MTLYLPFGFTRLFWVGSVECCLELSVKPEVWGHSHATRESSQLRTFSGTVIGELRRGNREA